MPKFVTFLNWLDYKQLFNYFYKLAIGFIVRFW